MSVGAEHAPVRIPAPFIYAVFLGAALLLQWLLPLPGSAPVFMGGIGLAAVLGGLVIGGLAVRRMRRAHTSINPHRPTTTLVTDGPFRFSRNPIYLGFLFIFIGFTLVAGTLWGVVLAPLAAVVVNYLVIRAEEGYLQRKFAGDYMEYRARVRRWL